MIENLAEVQTYLEAQKENAEVKTYMDSFKVQPTLEVFKGLANTNAEYKSFMDSEKDKHSTKGLETWKTNNLNALVDAEVKKRFPDIDPKDIKYQELENRFNLAEQGRLKETLTNKALKLAQEKKLPIELIDFLISEDEASTISNINTLSKIFLARDEALKIELLKGNTYVPPTGNKTPITVTKEDFDKMTYQNRIKLLSENPELYKELNK